MSIEYVQKFSSGGVIYYLVTRKKKSSGQYNSQLVRVCQDKNAEIPITCNSKDGKLYNLVQVSFVGQLGSEMARELQTG